MLSLSLMDLSVELERRERKYCFSNNVYGAKSVFTLRPTVYGILERCDESRLGPSRKKGDFTPLATKVSFTKKCIQVISLSHNPFPARNSLNPLKKPEPVSPSLWA